MPHLVRNLTVRVGCAAIVLATASWFIWGSDPGMESAHGVATGERRSAAAEQRLLRPLTHRVVPVVNRQTWPTAGTVHGLEQKEVALANHLEQRAHGALLDHPGDVGAILDLGRRLLWLGNWIRAEELANAALAIAEGDPFALGLLSAVRYEQGRAAEGLRLAQSALATSDRVPLALLGRARATAARGDLTAAITELEHAASMDADEPLIAFALACVLVDASRFAAARSWLQRSLAFVIDEQGKRPYLETNLAIAQMLGEREPLACKLAPEGTLLPLQLMPLPAVRCTLRGRGKQLDGLVVLDCGASNTILGPMAAELAHPTDGTAWMSGVAGTSPIGSGILDHLVLGDLDISNVPALLDRTQVAAHAPGVLATIGTATLRHFTVTIDTARETCRFQSLATPSARRGNGATIPFQLCSNQLLVPAHFQGSTPRTFLFDTGASAVFVSTRVLVEEFGQLAGRAGTQVSISGEESRTIEVAPPRPLVFGGLPMLLPTIVGDPTVESRNQRAHLETAGTIGLVLRARYEIDFARQLLHLSQ